MSRTIENCGVILAIGLAQNSVKMKALPVALQCTKEDGLALDPFLRLLLLLRQPLHDNLHHDTTDQPTCITWGWFRFPVQDWKGLLQHMVPHSCSLGPIERRQDPNIHIRIPAKHYKSNIWFKLQSVCWFSPFHYLIYLPRLFDMTISSSLVSAHPATSQYELEHPQSYVSSE